jgi:membrane protease YdiL (CAAX protease family)
MGVAFFLVVIDKFVYNFGGEIISPIIAEVLILLVPAYLCLLITEPQKKLHEQLKTIGMGKLSADYIFFIVFSALLLISTSFLLNVIFGAIYPISKGFTLMGTFTAGVREYTVAYPYLIVVYAVVPAIIEELLFRGLLYNLFSKLGEDISVALSVLISALFSFTVTGLPTALLCGAAYCFIRKTTRSLQASMIVHFLLNLYCLFVQTNLAKYFLSSNNNLLLIMIVLVLWLISASLFFTEAARIYRIKAQKISSGEEASEISGFKPSEIWKKLKMIFSHRASIICSAVLLVLFAATTLIGYLV